MEAVARVHVSPPRRAPLAALLGANAISLAGNTLSGVAIPWYVLETTDSALRAGLVAVAGIVPTIVAAAVGGAVVDRLGHKRTSVLADVASGGSVALIPLLDRTTGLAFWHLLVLVFLGALLDAPGSTARDSLLPDLAAAAALPLERANAAAHVIQSLAGLLGPPLAGLLVVAFGPSDVLWLDAASFAVSAGLVALAVPAPPPRERATGRYLDEVRDGLRFLRGDRLLVAIGLTAAVVNFLAAPLFGVVIPVYARTVLGSASDLGLVLAGFGAGSLLGATAFGVLGPRLPRRRTLIGASIGIAVPFWALAATPSLALTVAAFGLTGLATGVINPLAITVLQERVPTALRGRVFGAFMATVLIAAPLGMLLTGALIEAVGLRSMLLGQGVACLAVTLSMFVNPAFRELDRPGSSRAASGEPSTAAGTG